MEIALELNNLHKKMFDHWKKMIVVIKLFKKMKDKGDKGYCSNMF